MQRLACSTARQARCTLLTSTNKLVLSRSTSTKTAGIADVEVDADGIPVRSTYSIKALLADLPCPSVSDAQFIHLHRLAALIPPVQGSEAFKQQKAELEEMIRLVEGVRDTTQARDAVPNDGKQTLPDGRIWPQGQGIPLDWNRDAKQAVDTSHNGRKLLDLASKKHMAGFYTVKRQKIESGE